MEHVHCSTPTVQQISLRKTSPAVFQIHSFNFWFDGKWFAARDFDSREFYENSYSIFPVVTHVAVYV